MSVDYIEIKFIFGKTEKDLLQANREAYQSEFLGDIIFSNKIKRMNETYWDASIQYFVKKYISCSHMNSMKSSHDIP
jgi:hypothetical protein